MKRLASSKSLSGLLIRRSFRGGSRQARRSSKRDGPGAWVSERERRSALTRRFTVGRPPRARGDLLHGCMGFRQNILTCARPPAAAPPARLARPTSHLASGPGRVVHTKHVLAITCNPPLSAATQGCVSPTYLWKCRPESPTIKHLGFGNSLPEARDATGPASPRQPGHEAGAAGGRVRRSPGGSGDACV